MTFGSAMVLNYCVHSKTLHYLFQDSPEEVTAAGDEAAVTTEDVGEVAEVKQTEDDDPPIEVMAAPPPAAAAADPEPEPAAPAPAVVVSER